MQRVLDRGGRVLTLRDATRQDAHDARAIEDLLDRLSPRSTRQRFLSTSRRAGPQYVTALGDPLRTLDTVLVEAGSRVVGVGSTHPLPDAAVEFAVAVDDEDQGHGIGTLIMEALVARARQRGARTMVGTVLGANTQMFDVLAHLGLSCRSVVEGGTVDVTLTLSEDPSFASAQMARTENARAAAVRPFLMPAGVAVLLPSAAIRAGSEALAGRPETSVVAIDRVDGGYDVPRRSELALVPGWLSDAGPAALACAEAGVPAIVLLGRPGDGAARAYDVLSPGQLERIRAAGARVLGPGCECVVNTNPLIRLQVGPDRSRVVGGTVAVIADDATWLDPLLTELASRGLGVSTMVDVGVAMDLGVGDLLAWLAQDPRTEVVLVTLRGPVPDELLAELGRVHATRKPVLLLTADHQARERATPSNRPGPVRATSIEDLAEVAMMLVLRGQPGGPRVVVVTNDPWAVHAGANRQLARDALFGPDLTQHSEMRIHFLTPGATTHDAVIALPSKVNAKQVQDVLETLTDDPGVDAIVVALSPSRSLRQQSLWRLLRALPRERTTGRRVPVVVAVDRSRSRLRRQVPVFTSVDHALDALSRTCLRQSP